MSATACLAHGRLLRNNETIHRRVRRETSHAVAYLAICNKVRPGSINLIQHDCFASPQGRNATSPARQCWERHHYGGESASSDGTKTRCNHVSEPECTAVCAEHRRLNPRTFSTTKQFTAEYAENAEKLKPFLRTLRSAVGYGQTQSERDSGWFPYVIHSPQGRNIISPARKCWERHHYGAESASADGTKTRWKHRL
jgi:hypothetical protein